MGAHQSPLAILLLPLFTSLLTTFPSTIRAEPDATLHQRVAEKLDKELSAHLSEKPDFGVAIAVVDDGEIVWDKASGCVDGQGSRPVDVNTIFGIQSMSKSFTALAVLMAVQDGLVDLDTPIAEYLPDFKVNSRYDKNPEKRITLRLLLTHRAGFTFEAPFGSQYDDRYDFEKHIESISETWLRYPVGYRCFYSNVGFDLAGFILQVRSGMPFEQYVKEKVLDPIGMDNSSLDMTWIERNKNRATGHSDHGEIIPLRVPMIPAGGVYSSLHDMAKYLRFHINKGVVDGRRILRADLMDEMHTVQFARPRQRSGYCLGLSRDPVSNSYYVRHSGAGYGFSSDMIMFPKLKLGVIHLCSSMDNEFTCDVVRNHISSCIIAQNGDTPVDPAGTDGMTSLSIDDPRIQTILGHYGDARVGAVTLERNDSNVGFRVTPEQIYDLEFYDDNGELVGMLGLMNEIRFLPPRPEGRGSMYVVDRRLGSGSDYQVLDFNYSSDEPPGPDKPEWAKYLGEYEVMRYGMPFPYTGTVSIKNGYLFYNDCKCVEYEPGLFFLYDGEALDFRSGRPTLGGIALHRK